MRFSRRILATAATLLGCVLLAGGCGKPYRLVKIDSNPPGAAIFVNGEMRGTTPAEKVKIDFGADPQRRAIIQVVKDRFKPVFQTWTLEEVPSSGKTFQLDRE